MCDKRNLLPGIPTSVNRHFGILSNEEKQKKKTQSAEQRDGKPSDKWIFALNIESNRKDDACKQPCTP